MRSIWEMFKLIREQRWKLLGVVVANSVLGLGVLVNPYFFKAIVDSITKSASLANASNQVIRLIIILALFQLALTVFGFLQEALTDLTQINTNISLRRILFNHVLDLSIEYYETHRAGDISQQLTQGVYDFSSWLSNMSQSIFVLIISVVVAAVAITLKNPLAGLITLIAIPLHIGISLRKVHKNTPLRKKANILLEKMFGTLAETVFNMTTVRTLGSEQPQLDRYNEITSELKALRYRQFPIEWWHNAGRDLVEALATVTAVGVVAIGAIHGKYTPGDVLLVALLVQQAVGSLRPIARFIDNTGDVSTSCQRTMDLLAVQPTVIDRPDAVVLKEIQSMEFRGVSFSYPGHEQVVLKNVSFKLERGQTLALVGPSGTGKTTLIKLLLRLYDQTEGEFLINGLDAHNFTGQSVRQHMGVVMQDVALFNATFEENLRLAKAKAKRTELEEAVRLAHAKEFVDKFPEGYDTLVGERGIRLSGGQKQRLAIARALLKEPQMVILDEATSALDSVSEREVQAGLNSLTSDRMTVVIAHRLSTIREATNILVIENGKVEEQGNHSQLLKAGGLYAKLYDMQSERLLA